MGWSAGRRSHSTLWQSHLASEGPTITNRSAFAVSPAVETYTVRHGCRGSQAT